MQRILICSGVLGFGTALVFGLATLTAIAFPNGTVVSTGMNGVRLDRGWAVGGDAVSIPAPQMLRAPGGGSGGWVTIDTGTGTDVAPAP